MPLHLTFNMQQPLCHHTTTPHNLSHLLSRLHQIQQLFNPVLHPLVQSTKRTGVHHQSHRHQGLFKFLVTHVNVAPGHWPVLPIHTLHVVENFTRNFFAQFKPFQFHRQPFFKTTKRRRVLQQGTASSWAGAGAGVFGRAFVGAFSPWAGAFTDAVFGRAFGRRVFVGAFATAAAVVHCYTIFESTLNFFGVVV